MNTIKDLIPSVIHDLAKKQPQQLDMAQLWQRICGNANGSRLEGIKNGNLTVVVDSSARKMQLFRKRQELLEELQNKDPKIKNIYFKVGSV
jgi:predicted nucleic acid-binding Zn ribbon protein